MESTTLGRLIGRPRLLEVSDRRSANVVNFVSFEGERYGLDRARREKKEPGSEWNLETGGAGRAGSAAYYFAVATRDIRAGLTLPDFRFQLVA